MSYTATCISLVTLAEATLVCPVCLRPYHLARSVGERVGLSMTNKSCTGSQIYGAEAVSFAELCSLAFRAGDLSGARPAAKTQGMEPYL